MTRSRFFSLVCWMLFASFVVGLGVFLDMALPIRPRWTQKGVELVGMTQDGRSMVTTRYPEQPRDDLGNGMVTNTSPVQIWNLATGQETARYFTDGETLQSVTLTPGIDETIVALVTRPSAALAEIVVVDLVRGTTRKMPTPLHRRKSLELYVSPKFPFAVFRQSDANAATVDISFLNLQTGTILHEYKNVDLDAFYVASERLYRISYTAGTQRVCELWDTKTGKKLATADAFGRNDLEIVGREDTLATVQTMPMNRQKVTIWDMQSAEPLFETVTEQGDVHISKDGHWALVGEREAGKQATFWNLHERRRIGSMMHKSPAGMDVFTDNGKARLLLFSSDAAAEIRVLEAETLQLIWKRELTRHNNLSAYLWQPDKGRFAIHVAPEAAFEFLSFSDGKTLSRIPVSRPGRPSDKAIVQCAD